jgi:DNA uptake protein ComE-like DNA-binding protein
MRTGTRFTVWAIAIACLGVPGMSQYERNSGGALKTMTNPPPPEARIDINHGTEDQLMTIPSMTHIWARRIIRFRPYRIKSDLMGMGVIPDDMYDRIKDYVIAHREK